ncbi:cation-dependent mannose-6-phosphate receptor-like [Coccinella septempunctata]|uniref:cation-dependent mannose-6-phosphate receptor-like n=1 Tax=Coccinella septempunctata TaxID=41139 RepID=UPI001D06DDA1|nr:cation-dependent mannose-6-phosphate receptor-like [Coccinella septempunctata]
MAKLFFFGLLLYFSIFIYVYCDDTQQCTIRDPKNPCVCYFEDKRKIDISNLFPKKKDAPDLRFLEAQKDDYRFFFHGCTSAQFKPSDYNIESNKTLTGSLIVYNTKRVGNKTIPSLEVLGNPTDIKYHVLPDEAEPNELIFQNKDNITAAFRLICEHYDIPYIQIIDDPKSRQFTLNSPHACVIESSDDSSTGATLLMIFLISCVIYFVGGGCLLHFVRGARGIEIIPNIDFWRKLPGLIKDGTLFLFGGCSTNYLSSSEVYDRI